MRRRRLDSDGRAHAGRPELGERDSSADADPGAIGAIHSSPKRSQAGHRRRGGSDRPVRRPLAPETSHTAKLRAACRITPNATTPRPWLLHGTPAVPPPAVALMPVADSELSGSAEPPVRSRDCCSHPSLVMSAALNLPMVNPSHGASVLGSGRGDDCQQTPGPPGSAAAG
jgi:hypothetical protein